MARYRGWLGFALGIVVAGVAWWGFSAMRTARQDAESSTVATLLKARSLMLDQVSPTDTGEFLR